MPRATRSTASLRRANARALVAADIMAITRLRGHSLAGAFSLAEAQAARLRANKTELKDDYT